MTRLRAALAAWAVALGLAGGPGPAVAEPRAGIDPRGLLAERIDPSGPGEPAPPSGHAVGVRAALVPEAVGTRLTFVDLMADVALTPKRANQHALRVALQGGRADVSGDTRTIGMLGNLRLEYWYVPEWVDERPGDEPDRGLARNAVGLGVSSPLTALVDAGAGFYEQRAEVSVPSYAIWGRWSWIWSAGRTAVMVDSLLGLVLGEQGVALAASLTPTVSFELMPGLAGSVAFVAPGQFYDFNPTVLIGARWRPIRAIELALGTHLVPRGFDGDEPLSPLRPVVELRGHL